MTLIERGFSSNKPPCFLVLESTTRTTTDPLVPFFEVVRLRWVLVSLWAAKRTQQHYSRYAFLCYCHGEICNTDSTSAALNKWMESTIGDGYVVYGLRHSLRDRIRATECSPDIFGTIRRGGDVDNKLHWPCIRQRLWHKYTVQVDTRD